MLDRYRYFAYRLWRWPSPRFRLTVRRYLRGQVGLEIGGPSKTFAWSGQWPVYDVAARVDNLDFARETLWSGQTGPRSRGPVLVGEASQLEGMADQTYRFLLASHVIEHLANPLQALSRWSRVVSPGGLVVLVVPHKEGTFDHLRPTTSVHHFWADYVAGLDETDDSHFAEVIACHDLNRDADITDRDQLALRVRNNAMTRAVHHHVFETETVLELLDLARLHIVYVDTALPYHICVVAAVPVKLEQLSAPIAFGPQSPSNRYFWGPRAAW